MSQWMQMSFMDRVRFTTKAAEFSGNSTVVNIPAVTGDVAQVSDLPKVVAAAFGINTESDRVTRAQAMSVPSVARGREVIAGTIGSAALVAYDKNGNPTTRSFLSQPNKNFTRSHMLTWLVDDLIFYGYAFWLVTSRDPQGYPATADRITHDRITWTDRTVRIDGKTVADADLIRFDSDNEGILKYGGRTLKTALMLEDAVRKFARLDLPLGVLKDSESGMTAEEIQDILDQWEIARQTRTTAYLPDGMEYATTAFDAQKIELGAARGMSTAEVARLMNLPPHMVNAPNGSSLTYATVESNRRDFVDFSLSPVITSIEQRLSMGDVTPNTLTVRLDLTRFLMGDTSNVISAGAEAVRAGIMTSNEVRTQWLGLAPLNIEVKDDNENSNASN